MNTDTVAFFAYLVAFVALIVLQFVRATRLRRLVRNLNQLQVGERFSSSAAHQFQLLHMTLPAAPQDSSAELIRERMIYRRLIYACLLLLAAVMAFPFLAHRVWPVG